MDRKVVKYDIIKAVSADYLGVFVMDWIREGWELYGSPFHTGETFCQAMVIYA